MDLKLIIKDIATQNTYDASQTAEQVTVKKTVDGNAGELTCILQKDPNDILRIKNGNLVVFTVDNVEFFVGYIFKIGTDMDENYKITCYDQMRYLKNSDIYTFKNGETASQIFEKICKDYDLKYEVRTPIWYTPPPHLYTNKTLYAIINRGLQLASINDKRYYYIIDEGGKLVLSDFLHEGSQTSITLGDGAGVTSFTYERSIDSDTYDVVKIYKESKEETRIDQWTRENLNGVKQWGILQLLKQADDTMNEAQIKEQADNLLKTKARETETLKIQAEGILECVAGKRIRFKLSRENMEKWMWIKSSTHTFNKYEHTMDLEVEV